jgi:hypothetical protein
MGGLYAVHGIMYCFAGGIFALPLVGQLMHFHNNIDLTE